MSYSVVWFKRDLRVHDHTALFHAARSRPVLCLYVIESSLWAASDASRQHYQFLIESLRDLYAQLRQKGGRLWVVTGDVDAVLERLHSLAPFAALYSHEETGNGLTYQRDLAVARWCRQHDIPWHEFAQFGVTRRLKSRDDWKGLWDAHDKSPQFDLSADQPLMWTTLPWHEPAIPTALELGLNQADVPLRQKGGRKAGLAVLNSFLTTRSGHYRGGISSPLSAPTACSRISPFLALGCLSLREVVQATRQQMVNLPDAASRHKQGLVAFISRLYWHCHFIQKLESEPALEYQNVHRGYDGLREGDWNPAHFDALVAGRTGWPLVDACVAMLRETGWINFRMRAMLVSVAAYPLWLHWRPVGLWLAQQFLDYEPGIHWSQMQMQSGTTGINTTRIYNPIKQAMDHDPNGDFVRHWLPAMRRVPDAWLFEPWRMPPDLQEKYGVRVGLDIPLPLVDLQTATREAKQRMYALRAQPTVQAGKAAIVEKHASRKMPGAAKSRRKTRNPEGQDASRQFSTAQLGLDF